MPEKKKDDFEIKDEEIFKIIETSNFKELYDSIKQKGGIAGSKQKYEPEYLITLIEDFRKTFKKLINTANVENPFKKTNLLKLFSKL